MISLKDFEALSGLVDDKAGLQLMPYYTSNRTQGRHLDVIEVKSFFSDVAKRDWGSMDGSGAPINLSNSDYYEKFIYSENFIGLGRLSEGSSLASGNTVPLDQVLEELFKGREVKYVEYYIPGIDPKYDGMDWESLALVFEKINGAWKLVGILHNQWTI
jgi:hypothetical protein